MSVEERTRDSVLRLVHENGPMTAVALATALDLSAAAVRRHLDSLVADRLLVEKTPRVGVGPRGRGRPAKSFSLTETGRSTFGHAYDDLAATALRYLRSTGGDAAVTAFAEHRAGLLTERIAARLGEADRGSASAPTRSADDTAARVATVAEVLTAEGYAANSSPAGAGLQLCQHHCPVAGVAAEFVELCEAETRALSEVLGTNVQRLATIAHGDGVCTTHVPAGRAAPPARTDVMAGTTP